MDMFINKWGSCYNTIVIEASLKLSKLKDPLFENVAFLSSEYINERALYCFIIDDPKESLIFLPPEISSGSYRTFYLEL